MNIVILKLETNDGALDLWTRPDLKIVTYFY